MTNAFLLGLQFPAVGQVLENDRGTLGAKIRIPQGRTGKAQVQVTARGHGGSHFLAKGGSAAVQGFGGGDFEIREKRQGLRQGFAHDILNRYAQNIFCRTVEQRNFMANIGGDDARSDGGENIIHQVFHFQGLVEGMAQIDK